MDNHVDRFHQDLVIVGAIEEAEAEAMAFFCDNCPKNGDEDNCEWDDDKETCPYYEARKKNADII